MTPTAGSEARRDHRRAALQDPEAARRAVTDKLKIEAAASPWQLGDLQRQYAYDQLVERLYRADDAWVADKVCAIFERHNGNPSTRFKDLIDLVAISRRATMNADLQKRALVTEAARRNLELPAAFDVPDRTIWQRGYRAEARRTVGLEAVDLEEALTAVRPFLDPLLDATATGSWDPHIQSWG